MNQREWKTDVAIVGAGVIGMCCALELARRGRRVTILDRGEAGRGASFGNAGWLTPSLAFSLAQPGNARKALIWMMDPESPFYIRPALDPSLAWWLIRFLFASRRSTYERATRALVELSRWSTEAWRTMAAENPGRFGFAGRGLLMVLESEKGLKAAIRTAEFTGTLGVNHERWGSDRIRADQPAIIGPLAGGIFFPDDAHCEPDKAMDFLRDEVRRAGVEVIENSEVTDAEVNGSAVRALHTGAGCVIAADVVLAAGAWSGSVGRAFGLRLPMRGAKGYSMRFPRADVHPTRSIYLAERKITVTPHEDALRIAGTLELVGDDLSVNQRRVNAIVRGARGMLRLNETVPAAPAWAGLRPCLPDGMPVIGRSPSVRNLWLATGHQMTGLKTGPGSGRLLAELMCSEKPTFDPAPFRPGR